jgi:4'-phosphopantetheinyl transferase
MVSDVYVWHAALDVEAGVASFLEDTLSADERDRADRFRFARDRRRFVAARALLRTILGRWLDRDPGGLSFLVGSHGKPYLAESDGEPPFFNVAHSGDHALIAVTRHAPVGVDIEIVREAPDPLAIAERFFSARETAAIRQLPRDRQRLAFFQHWTLKEAYVKALGTGLSHPFDGFEVTLVAGGPPRLGSTDPAGQVDGWSLRDLSNLPEYAAALAVQASDVRVERHELLLDRPPAEWFASQSSTRT